MRKLATGFSLLVGLLAWGTMAGAQSPERLIVSPDGAYTTLADALAEAHNGDIIEVQGGVHPAPLLIDKSITLIGVDQPVIDGGGVGSLITITAPDVVMQGFVVRDTGDSMPGEDTAIIAQAPRITLAENRLENVLYGIYLNNAPGSIVRHNLIYPKDVEETLRGDGIRAWYSHDIQIVENEVYGGRDVILTYTDNAVIRNNIVHQGRYGLHFMYSNNVTVEGNDFEDNSVGVFLMYSQNIILRQNTFAYSDGSSGYGLALKDMDYVTASDNVFLGNTVGLYLDNSPSIYDAYNTFQNNIFAYNFEGVAMMPSVERNIFQNNAFLDNTQQAAIRGREVTSRNIWSQDGKGNYWSDYVGYDRDGDGIGDTSYHADKLFQSLADRYPVLHLFNYSPVAQLIEFGASAFPVLRPVPIVVDDAPFISYTPPAALQAQAQPISLTFLGAAAALIGFSLTLVALAAQKQTAHRSTAFVAVKEDDMITVENLSKRYGNYAALKNLTFSVKHGESLALWGDNGAGKTTALLCLLGVHPFEGRVTVNGIDVRQHSKLARMGIGYIPQEVKFYDMSVQDNLLFYARLKKVSTTNLTEVLDRVGLGEARRKAVRSLSGGMKQRLALAIGLLGDPPVLLLDEPTANLDVQARREFLDLVQGLNQSGKTIVFTTHRLEEVAALAGRVLVLKDGQIEVECTPAELPEKLGLQKWLRIYVPHDQRAEALRLLEGQGFRPVLNSTAFYVKVPPQEKMIPLRLLEAASIPVQDFDVVDTRPEAHHD